MSLTLFLALLGVGCSSRSLDEEDCVPLRKGWEAPERLRIRESSKDGSEMVCPSEYDQYLTSLDTERISRDDARPAMDILLLDLEKSRRFLSELSPQSQNKLKSFFTSTYRGLFYESLENPQGGFLSINRVSFSESQKEIPYVKDKVLLPEEIQENLTDEELKTVAQIITQSSDKVPPERLTRFLASIDSEAKQKLDTLVNQNLSRWEKLQSKMKNGFPLVTMDETFDDSLYSRFLDFDENLEVMKQQAQTQLRQRFHFDLPNFEEVDFYLMSTQWAQTNGKGNLAEALLTKERTSIYLRVEPDIFNPHKFWPAVIHELTHAMISLLYEKNLEAHPGVKSSVPPWFHEAVAMEASGEIGRIKAQLWQYKLEGRKLGFDPAREKYAFGEAFYFTWTQEFGDDAWEELLRVFLFEEPDFYKAADRVAKSYKPNSNYSNEYHLKARVNDGCRTYWNQMSQQAIDEYDQIRLDLGMQFFTDYWKNVYAQAKNQLDSDPSILSRAAEFELKHPSSPLRVDAIVLRLVHAFESQDMDQTEKALSELENLLDQLKFSNEAVDRRIIHLRAGVAFIKGDSSKFEKELNRSRFKEKNFYTEPVNHDIDDWISRSKESKKEDSQLLQEFLNSF